MLFRLMLITVIAVTLLGGCVGFDANWEPSWRKGFTHEKGHFRAFWQDLSGIHQFIDRHLFNLDEMDPTRY